MEENRQHDMEVDIKEVLQEIAELRTTMIGMDGNNGMRSQLNALRQDFNDLLEKIRKYKYEERANTCIGAKLVGELRKELKEKESKERADMKLDKETMVALEKIATSARNSRRTNIITLVGLVLIFFTNMAPYIFG